MARRCSFGLFFWGLWTQPEEFPSQMQGPVMPNADTGQPILGAFWALATGNAFFTIFFTREICSSFSDKKRDNPPIPPQLAGHHSRLCSVMLPLLLFVWLRGSGALNTITDCDGDWCNPFYRDAVAGLGWPINYEGVTYRLLTRRLDTDDPDRASALVRLGNFQPQRTTQL